MVRTMISDDGGFDVQPMGIEFAPIRGIVPTFRKAVPIEALRIDSEYQRGPAHVGKLAEIAKAFNWTAFMAACVSQREEGDAYFVLDGQQRTLAAALRGVARVPCLIYTGLTQQEEAEAFVQINGRRRPPSGMDVFISEIVAENPLAIEMKACLHRHGLCVTRSHNPDGNNLRAIRSVRRLYAIDADSVDEVLDFVQSVYPQDPDRLRGVVLESLWTLARLLKAQALPCLNDEDVRLKFRRAEMDIQAILYRARRAARLANISAARAITEEIAQVYNKGMRSKRHRVELNGTFKNE